MYGRFRRSPGTCSQRGGSRSGWRAGGPIRSLVPLVRGMLAEAAQGAARQSSRDMRSRSFPDFLLTTVATVVNPPFR